MASAVEAQGATGIGATFRLGSGLSDSAWSPQSTAFWNVALVFVFVAIIVLAFRGMIG